MLKRFFLLCCFVLMPALMLGYDDPFVPDDIVNSDLPDTSDSTLYWMRFAPDGYYMQRMVIDVTVHADRSYDVSEQLDAYFTEPRHGLYRSIPVGFWVNRDVSPAQDSTQFAMRYNGVEVQNLEVSEEFDPQDVDGLIDVRIGSADVLVKGNHTYRLSYTLQLPDDRVEYSDLFFHSVVGSGWTCRTDSVLFAVHFDEALPLESLDRMKVYFGSEGDEADFRNSVVTYTDAHTICGVATNLYPNVAVTIDMPLPEGYFIKGKPSVWYYLSWLMVGITLLLIIKLILNELKSDQPVTSVVTFQPSAELNSADVGSLVDGSADDIDLLSLIPWFASRGYIQISSSADKPDQTVLVKLCNLPADAPKYQQTLFNGFFAKGDTFNINKTSVSFGRAWTAAKQELDAHYKDKLDYQEGGFTLLLSTFCFSLMMCFAQVPPDGWAYGAVFHVCLLALLFLVSLVRNQIIASSVGKGCAGCITKAISLGGIGFGLFLCIGTLITGINMSDDYYLPFNVRVVMTLLELLVVLCSSRLWRKTAFRRKYLGEVKGLKEFIETAEKDRLQMLLDQDERYFYNILPYAMAFGMVDKWAAKFEGLTVQPVQEFSNVNIARIPSMMSSQRFMSSVNRSVSAHTPSSSGGSYHSSSGHHGGYSGGGSGGGGGRSW